MYMCAIAGMIDLAADEETIRKMLSTMRRRGPDGSGIYTDGSVTLLHSRLAIIDPAGGAQPMTFLHEGESFTIVYNGELYNTQQVRHRLTQLGHRFRGHSDTEVLLHAYAQWGAQCLEMLNGIFAFGVWEKKRRRLFLARDRMGVKPLFWKKQGSGILFASEMKTLLCYPGVEARLDAQGTAELVMLGPGRTPGCGVLKDFCEIRPGWYAYYENGELTDHRYWQLLDRPHEDTFETTVECVRWLVEDSVVSQMVSDVPIGAFLSGGLDSSLISSICASRLASRGERLKTFSVDYVDHERYFQPGKFQPAADTAFIRQMEGFLECEHHWTVLDPVSLSQSLEASVRARDLPGMADVDSSLLCFCGEIRKEVKVALSGECADEIFGGYPWYTDPKVRESEGFPWAQDLGRRIDFLRPEFGHMLNLREYVMDRYEQTCAEADVLPGTSGQERRMKQMVNLNMNWFMQTLLDRKDRMSMYHGLEVRVPFCDYRIAEYLYSVPWHMKYHRGAEKGLLRTAMTGFLPEEILWRKKSPYPKTHDPKYMELMTGKLKVLLENGDAPIFDLIQKEALKKLLHSDYEWPWYGQLMKVPQTIAYMVQLNYWLKEYQVRIV